MLVDLRGIGKPPYAGIIPIATTRKVEERNRRQIGVYSSVSPGAHLVIQLVDRVKCGLGPGCYAWPRGVSPQAAKLGWLDA